eukprot:COSAG06_NODE_12759_length_1333_cov_2.100486_3_plen_232_part_00
MILPRQARDKHRESTLKKAVLVQTFCQSFFELFLRFVPSLSWQRWWALFIRRLRIKNWMRFLVKKAVCLFVCLFLLCSAAPRTYLSRSYQSLSSRWSSGVRKLRKRISFWVLSLCMPRACLGKRSISSINRRKWDAFSHLNRRKVLVSPARGEAGRAIRLAIRPEAVPSLRQNGLFVSFPYVCPEPVLAKSSFLDINGAKSPIFHLCDGAGGAHQVVPACDNPSDKNIRVT